MSRPSANSRPTVAGVGKPAISDDAPAWMRHEMTVYEELTNGRANNRPLRRMSAPAAPGSTERGPNTARQIRRAAMVAKALNLGPDAFDYSLRDELHERRAARDRLDRLLEMPPARQLSTTQAARILALRVSISRVLSYRDRVAKKLRRHGYSKRLRFEAGFVPPTQHDTYARLIAEDQVRVFMIGDGSKERYTALADLLDAALSDGIPDDMPVSEVVAQVTALSSVERWAAKTDQERDALASAAGRTLDRADVRETGPSDSDIPDPDLLDPVAFEAASESFGPVAQNCNAVLQKVGTQIAALSGVVAEHVEAGPDGEQGQTEAVLRSELETARQQLAQVQTALKDWKLRHQAG